MPKTEGMRAGRLAGNRCLRGDAHVLGGGGLLGGDLLGEHPPTSSPGERPCAPRVCKLAHLNHLLQSCMVIAQFSVEHTSKSREVLIPVCLTLPCSSVFGTLVHSECRALNDISTTLHKYQTFSLCSIVTRYQHNLIKKHQQ